MNIKLVFSMLFILSVKISSCDYICPPRGVFIIDTISEGTVRKVNFPPISWYSTPLLFPIPDSLTKDTVSIDTYSVATIDSVFHRYYDGSNFIFAGRILSEKRYRTDTTAIECYGPLGICHHEYTFYDSIDYQVTDCFKGNIAAGDTLHFYFIKDYHEYFGGECDFNQGYKYVENSLAFNNGKNGFFPYQLRSDDFVDRECGTEKKIGWWFIYNNRDSCLSLQEYPGVSLKLADALNNPTKVNFFKAHSLPQNISIVLSGHLAIVRFKEQIKSAEISVYAISGKLIQQNRVYNCSNYTLTLRNYPKGPCILKITTNNTTITRKILMICN